MEVSDQGGADRFWRIAIEGQLTGCPRQGVPAIVVVGQLSEGGRRGPNIQHGNRDSPVPTLPAHDGVVVMDHRESGRQGLQNGYGEWFAEGTERVEVRRGRDVPKG